MKIATIVSLLAVISPCVTALKGAAKQPHRRLDDEDDGILGGIDVEDLLGDVCFSESSTVQVLNKGAVTMKDLQVGDKVLTSSASYETVYAWGHNAPEEFGTFLQIKTADTLLEMTGQHFVFLDGQAAPVRADSLKVGSVLRGESAPATVTQIGFVTKKGLYAPLTTEGSLVVDGIVASSYISLQEGAHMVQFQGVETPMSQHTFIHMSLSPYRMICTHVMECHALNEQGIDHYVATGMKFISWCETQNVLMQIVLMTLGLIVLVACMFVENSMGAPLVVAAAAYGYMKVNRSSKVKTV